MTLYIMTLKMLFAVVPIVLLSVIMLNSVMLSVVAPHFRLLVVDILEFKVP
jgi:hypothetical protein